MCWPTEIFLRRAWRNDCCVVTVTGCRLSSEALLAFFPLDIYVDRPVALMAVVPGDAVKPTIWEDYRRIVKASGEAFSDFEYVERFAFYERAQHAFAVVATGEAALYANVILKKGVVKAP